MILISKIFVPKGFRGITIFPFIFLCESKDKKDKIIVNHEKIHLRQQTELLVFLFFIWYGVEFLIRLAKYQNKSIAYKNISFEREAYKNENDQNYLKKRKLWSFVKYL